MRIVRKTILRVLLAISLALVAAGSAFADTVRVTTDRALLWSSPSGVAVVLTQVSKDTVLEVVRRVGDWYEVVIPEPAAGTPRSGYLPAAQVTVELVGPLTAAAAQARSAQRDSSGSAKPLAHFLNVDIGYRPGTEDLRRSSVAFADRYAENGSIAGTYGKNTGWQFDVTGGQTLWRRIAVGLGVSSFLRKEPVSVDVRVPHPFFFNQLRAATFTSQRLEGHETTFNIPVLWRLSSGARTTLAVYGGPSIIRVVQVVVTDTTLTDAYPFDTVSVASLTTAERSGTVFGYHAGADFGFFFSRRIGVGVGARYSRAKIAFKGDSGSANDGFAGGAQAVIGGRFRF